ncbi:hypothetical protein NA57DRAFT_76452 [Rhizodiscina lignyota]|uniref:CENP-V/GFA domain-containing protein n=1 Tax=Rhizodiscina lignyota TaxID=1504668 RepID=A0A9P4M6F9_9PEZI|nr:hypothetical protein NA57DRAFT_76452 [Rhizodiscina lignyota]
MSSKKSKVPSTKSSSCLCGAVQLSVTGNDKGAVVCHCSNCQRASGSAFLHNYRFTSADLKFTKGEELVREYEDKETKTGNTLYRHFCEKCGSPLYLKNSAFPGLVVLHCGTMEAEGPQPSMELFPENKYAWIGDVMGKPRL